MPEIEVTESALADAIPTVAETDDDYTWLTERLDANQTLLTSLAAEMAANRTTLQETLSAMQTAHREQTDALQTMIQSLTTQNAALQTAQGEAFAAVLLKLTPPNSNDSLQTVIEGTPPATEATPETVADSASQEGQTSAPGKRRRL